VAAIKSVVLLFAAEPKKARAEGKKSHAKTMMSRKANEPKINTRYVQLRQNAEEKGRGKGLKEVWGDEDE
jgi:hypothetical protein